MCFYDFMFYICGIERQRFKISSLNPGKIIKTPQAKRNNSWKGEIITYKISAVGVLIKREIIFSELLCGVRSLSFLLVNAVAHDTNLHFAAISYMDYHLAKSSVTLFKKCC